MRWDVNVQLIIQGFAGTTGSEIADVDRSIFAH
jgi:hypothetical protein